jgi:hypothetical protein
MSNRPTKIRVDYSFHHYHAARYFCLQLQEIESCVRRADIGVTIQHQAYASGAVLSSVAFLESAINEFIPDADTNKFPTDSFNARTGAALSNLWPFVEKHRLLDKFQIALAVACRPMFDIGKHPYQEVGLLVHLRNALVHFKPEWDDELQDHLRIERQLRDKFPLNPLAGELDILFFPKRCLGHGCAQWSIDSAEKFIAEFYRRMNTEFLLEYLKPR